MNKNTFKLSSSAGFAIAGALITIIFFMIVNYITGSGYPWFIYPSFAVLWWPISVILAHRQALKLYSLAGSFILISFLIIVNYISSPEYLWFIYPAFAVLWWPIAVFLAKPRTIKAFSAVGAAILITFFVVINYMFSPFHLWFIYALYPVIWWPVSIFLGKKMSNKFISVLGCAITIGYYAALNAYIPPTFPWVIFPAYAVLWWPLGIFFAKSKSHLLFAITGALLSATFFIAVNIMTTPNQIWAVYPIFSLIWWPLAAYYFIERKISVK